MAAIGCSVHTFGKSQLRDEGNKMDVIVIGAGIMGSSTAYQVAKRGYKVLLLEQFDFLHHRGSSHGESRTIRETYPEHYYTAMVTESAKLWEEAESEIGYKVCFRTPQLDMGHKDDRSLLAVIANCESKGISHQVLHPHQIREKFSGRIQIPEGWVGVVSQTAGGVVKPTKAVAMFQTLALRNGAVLRDNAKVIGIRRDDKGGGILVSTADGRSFAGKKCVVTAGAWAKKLVKSFSGMDLPIQPLETCMLYWRIKDGGGHKSEISVAAKFPTFASYGRPYVYGTPSMEFPGLIKIAVNGGRACDPDERAWAPSVGMDALKEWIRSTFAGLVDSDEPAATQSCMYSMTPDEDFVIDLLGGDVAVGAGFSGHGFKMAPVVGRILAELVLEGEARGVDLGYFGLRRFQGNPKGNAKEFEEQVGISSSRL